MTTPQPSRLSLDDGAGSVLVASGVIDAHTAAELAAALDDRGIDADLHLDLTRVDFIDSSGLRVLVAAHHALDEGGHRLVLEAASEAVVRLLEITGLRDHFNLG